MSYIKAEKLLPKELAEQIQKYADGVCIYIPRKEENRRSWGDNTGFKKDIRQRNAEIYRSFLKGKTAEDLAKEYYLSIKSIHRVLLQEKRKLPD